MDWSSIITSLFELCIIPLLAVLTSLAITFIKAKKQEIESRNAEGAEALENKYISMALTTVQKCVVATNQTYVESLKASGKFDKEAQLTAFEKTKNAVLAILSDEAKTYLANSIGDLETYLTTLIESQVNENKGAV